jgi:hypothetical protein
MARSSTPQHASGLGFSWRDSLDRSCPPHPRHSVLLAMTPRITTSLAGLLLLVGGCAEPTAAPPGTSPQATAPEAIAPTEVTEPPASPAQAASIDETGRVQPLASPGSPGLAAPPDAIPQMPPAATPQPQEPVERVTADAGVGQRGRSLDQFQGAVERTIVEPARTLFAVRERLVFSTQIPQAMQLYKATHGRAPASEEEFMRDIIQANNIRLPELPQGQRYVYDPASEELLVERPAR